MAHSQTNPTRDVHESQHHLETAEVQLVSDFVLTLGLGCRWLRRKPNLDDYELSGRG